MIFNLSSLQPLKSPYDSCWACDLSGGEWEFLQAYGRSFSLEWIWVKHITFKHMRVKCVIPWGSTYLVCSIFKWKCLTFLNYLKMLFMIYYKFWRAWFFFPDGILMLIFYFILFLESECVFCPRRAKAKCGGVMST